MDDCYAGFVQAGDTISVNGATTRVEMVSHGHDDASGDRRVVVSGRNSRGLPVGLILKRTQRVQRESAPKDRDRTP